jgi:hypothetical protein
MFQIGDLVRVAHTGVFEDYHGVTTAMAAWARDQSILRVESVAARAITVAGPGTTYRYLFSPDNLVLAERGEIETFNPRILIRKAKDLIIKEHSHSNRNAVFSVIRNTNPEPHILGGPCHGDLRNRGDGANAIVTLIVRQGSVGYSEQHKQPPYEILLAFYDWLFNRSPYADCFMYKSAKNALREKCAVLRTDQPGNILQGALICTRNTWEFAPHIRIWHRLVQEGVNENLAFILCYCVSEREGAIKATSASRDHVAISTRIMTMQGAKAFLAGAPLKKTELYNKGGTYEGVIAAFEGRGNPFFPVFKNLFDSFGKKSSGNNPFIKAKERAVSGRAMTMQGFVKFVKANEDKFIQED